MALRNAWWMKTPPTGPSQAQPQPRPNTPLKPHLAWPWDHAVGGISFGVLERTLREHPGRHCKVDQFVYRSDTSAHNQPPLAPAIRPHWIYEKTASNIDELVSLLTQPLPAEMHSAFYIATSLQSEAIQALGHHLAITPRFFNVPYTPLSTGNTVKQYAFYSLQLMDKYSLGRKPHEATRLSNSPSYRFRETKGHYHPHEWHVTTIRLVFLEEEVGKSFRGLVHFDPVDDVLSDGLKTLMTRHEEIPPGKAEEYAGLGQILSETIYMVTFTWAVFLTEGEAHLQILSKRCVEESLTATEQLEYTRELHRLSPLWGQVRRRLVCGKDLAKHMIEHPFFSSIAGYNGRIAIEGYLGKQILMFEDHISRCNELAEQTNVLISLIFNIATLQDTRAAVEESKAANVFAASIRRVTMLTFIYLPLTLAASIIGMNVTEISGETVNPRLWAYFVISISLMVATFGGWFVWSRMLNRIDRRSRKWKGLLPTA